MAVKYKDYYEILGIKRSATQNEIKRAYRKLARKYHPDVSKEKNADKKFKEVTEAYEVLGSEENRKKYDQLGANWKAGQNFTPPSGWENVHFEFHGPRDVRSTFEEFGGPSDFFETLFGDVFEISNEKRASQRRGWAARGADHEAEITIALTEAFHGARKSFTLQAAELNEHGQIERRVKTYNVTIPAGTKHRSRIRLAGQGSVGRGGGVAGDLFLLVNIAPHPIFRLNGQDLEMDLPVSPWEAALGGRVAIPTMTGQATLKIPSGVQGGQRLRLRGKGFPGQSGKEAGDLYAEVKIELPTHLSPKERDLFKELAKQSSFNPRKSWQL